MYQIVGQDIRNDNLFSAIPIDENNIAGSMKADANNITTGDANSIEIGGENCFNCWYLISIQVENPAETQFVFSVPRNSDSGGIYEI